MQHYSPELAALVQHHLQPGARVLDLGPSTTGTTQALLTHQGRCFVEDLLDFVQQGVPLEQSLQALDQHLINKPADMSFDLVLCWDLLSYLPAELISHLFQRLQPHCHAGTRLHIIQPKGQPSPQPLSFRWCQDFHFDCIEQGSDPLPSWRHTTLTLQRCLHPFTLVESALQAQGMSQQLAEYVLEFDANACDKRLRSVASQHTSLRQSEQQQDIALPLLQELLQALPQNAGILDGGRKTGRQLQGLHEYAGNVFVEDILASIAWQHHLHPQSQQLDFSQTLLQYRAGVQVHGALLWDIPNYLPAAQMTQLQTLLQKILAPGAAIYCLSFNRTGLPKMPIAMDVLEHGVCRLSGEVVGDTPAQPVSTIALLKQWSDFTLRRHQLGRLENGQSFQEYWFVWLG